MPTVIFKREKEEMNHLQEMGGRDMWLERQMAEPVGTELSLLFLPPPSGSVHSFGRGEAGLRRLSGMNM